MDNEILDSSKTDTSVDNNAPQVKEGYISGCIRRFYLGKLVTPLLYIIVCVILCIIFPIMHLLFPANYDDEANLEQLYANREVYGNFTLHDLYFTGYTKQSFDSTQGYYYYTMMDAECVVVLLDPAYCAQGMPTITDVTIPARIMKESYAMNLMLENLAKDLSWTQSGITSTVSAFMLSQPDAIDYQTMFLKAAFCITFLYAAMSALFYLLCSIFPVLSPPVIKLMPFGNPGNILRHAEEELAVATNSFGDNDIFITKHYFVETSNNGVAIMPINRILWVYKYSTLHKFLWHHFAISYTLHITADKHRHVHCPKNYKTDLDSVMSYLNMANPNILVGFSEENRQRVEQIQGVPWSKLIHFFHK